MSKKVIINVFVNMFMIISLMPILLLPTELSLNILGKCNYDNMTLEISPNYCQSKTIEKIMKNDILGFITFIIILSFFAWYPPFLILNVIILVFNIKKIKEDKLNFYKIFTKLSFYTSIIYFIPLLFLIFAIFYSIIKSII